jgi:hypothetical protein
MERDRGLPSFRWGDRYDLLGLATGAAVLIVLLLAAASVSAALGLALGVAGLSAFALRRRAGVPQVTVWQRLARRRHQAR